MSARRLSLEIGVVIALACAAMWYGRFVYTYVAVPPIFYQRWFAPAVMVAAGRGFVNQPVVEGTALGDFLAEKRSSLALADIGQTEPYPPDQFQEATRYLMLAVGLWWRLTGVSWAAVADVAGGLHVMAVLGTYATFRLLLPLAPSLAGALWMCVSPLQLTYVAQVRDYSKGAFILCTIPLILVLALRAKSRRALLIAAGATGVVIGVGIGFKMDVVVMAPIALAVLLLFRGRRPWSDLREKAPAAGVLVLAMLVTAAPVLLRLSKGGSNAIHVILLGYGESFDHRLGIEPSLYGFMPFYDDAYVTATVRASAIGHSFAVPSAEYDQYGRELWFRIVRHFPADVIARAFAAARGTMNLLFENPPPPFLTRAVPAQHAIERAQRWLAGWGQWGAPLGVLVVVLVSMTSARRGLLAGVLLLALAGYPSLQFGTRHIFHLQMIPVLALLAVLWTVIGAAARFGRARRARRFTTSRREGADLRRPLVRLCAATLCVWLLTMAPLAALRGYQSHHLRTVLSAYVEGPRDRVDAELVALPNDRSLVRWPAADGRPFADESRQSSYYVVELEGDESSPSTAIDVRYGPRTTGTDFSRRLTVRSGTGIVRFGFPVYGIPHQPAFAGIEIESAIVRRLRGIYRMNGGPQGVPVDLRLPADWARRRLYQQLTAERALGWLGFSRGESEP